MEKEVENSTAGQVEAHDRTLERMIRDGWNSLFPAGASQASPPAFSGILPLRSPGLSPFLNKPGIFLILGPAPELPVLHIGAAPGPMDRKVWARLEPASPGGFVWRWEAESNPPPTYAACIAFSESQDLIPSLRAFLVQQIWGFHRRPGLGSPHGEAP